MKIAFVMPPAINKKFVEAEDCCWAMQDTRVLPAMLLACATEAKRYGHNVQFVDLSIEGKIIQADLIIHSLFWMCHENTNRALKVYCGNTPRIALAVPPGYAKQLRAIYPELLAVINSEPEMAMRTLPINREDLPKWTWADNNKGCLDQLNTVDFSIVPRNYWPYYSVAVYQATRGCPYKCKFCVWGGSTVNDTAFKVRPAQQVADDIASLEWHSGSATGKPIPLYLLAAQLTTSLKWIRELRAEMEGRDCAFQSNFSLRDVTTEKLRLLIESGMNSYSAGLEATTDELLEKLGKPYTIEQAKLGIAAAESVGLPYKLHILAGYGESAAQVKAAIEGLRQLHAAGMKRASINVTLVALLPGTVLGDTFTGKRIPHPSWPGFECDANVPLAEWANFAREVVRLKMSRRTSFRTLPIKL